MDKIRDVYIRALPVLRPFIVMAWGALGALIASHHPAYYQAFCGAVVA